MVDHLTTEKRSWNMSRIRSKNTKPEILLRSMLHKAGYRFRLNGKVAKRLHESGTLPGKPDIVLAKYRTVIFVHGCFWHRHKGCKGATTPKTKTDFWLANLAGIKSLWGEQVAKNVERDKKNSCDLRKLGWNIITIWECELKKSDKVMKKISAELAHTAVRKSSFKNDQSEEELPMVAEKREKYIKDQL